MVKRVFFVPGITCQHCVMNIKRAVLAVAGVKEVEADVQSKRVTVAFEPPADERAIRDALVSVGYPAEGPTGA
jgi:Cu+-exporting ATPase